MSKRLHDQLQAYWTELCDHYGYDGEMPAYVAKKFRAVLEDVNDSQEAYKRARDSAQTSILAAWAQKRCPGPNTTHSVEKQIKRALALASMLEKKGEAEQAQKQRQRAQELKEALQLVGAEPETMTLSAESFDKVVESIENPPAPGQALKELMRGKRKKA